MKIGKCKKTRVFDVFENAKKQDSAFFVGGTIDQKQDSAFFWTHHYRETGFRIFSEGTIHQKQNSAIL